MNTLIKIGLVGIAVALFSGCTCTTVECRRLNSKVEVTRIPKAQHDLYFNFDSSELNAASKKIVRANLSAMSEKTAAIEVVGHTDQRGSSSYNLILGKKRAETVKQYLASLGVAPTAIRTKTAGEAKPIDPRTTAAAWAKNRRVSLNLY